MVCLHAGSRRSTYSCSCVLRTRNIEEAAGASIALSAGKLSVLMGRMRSPSLSIHSIEGAFNGAGAKSVISSASAASTISSTHLTKMSPCRETSVPRRRLMRSVIGSKWTVRPNTPEWRSRAGPAMVAL